MNASIGAFRGLADLTSACGEDPSSICELVFDLTGSETTARVADLSVKPAKVVLILLVAWVLNHVVRRIIDRGVGRLAAVREEDEANGSRPEEETEIEPGRLQALQLLALRRAQRRAEQSERRRQRAETLGTVGRSIATLVIYTVAVLVALGEFDINLGPLLASAGIVGIAIGFGAQSLVKDFLSGIFMLIEDQYGVGDIVDVGEAAGVVEEVKLRTTKIRDLHGTLWHVPNGEIRRVANKSQEWARAVLDVDVAYDTDLGHAISVIKRTADQLWKESLPDMTVLEEPQVWGVETFGADAITIRLVVKVEPAEQWATAREMRRRLKQAFDDEGIEIPFPQRTVWLHEVSPAPSGPDESSATRD